MAFWCRVCPRCHGQGRLMIRRRIDGGDLFLCCDECMACWHSPADCEHDCNRFSQWQVKSATDFADEKQIRAAGWQVDLYPYRP